VRREPSVLRPFGCIPTYGGEAMVFLVANVVNIRAQLQS
jgi:hypothetical protein